MREQERGSAGRKVYTLHAPEVECIGKGKAHKPYEFGVKVCVATTLKHAQGRPVRHPCRRRCPAIPMTATRWQPSSRTWRRSSATPSTRILADAGYRGHNAPPDYKFRVFISGQKRRVTPSRSNARCAAASAVEPVIGHLKDEHRMGRNYLAHRRGDANNAILAAVGYNFRRLIRWLRLLLRQILSALLPRFRPIQPEIRVLHGRRCNPRIGPQSIARACSPMTQKRVVQSTARPFRITPSSPSKVDCLAPMLLSDSQDAPTRRRSMTRTMIGQGRLR